MTRKSLALLILPLCLAACGKYGALETAEGQALPPLAYGQDEGGDAEKDAGQTAEKLMEPSVQARPGRSDELLFRSERRGKDPFDLPPGSEPETEISEEKDPEAPSAPTEANQKKR